jgi:hypothetical protein
VQVVFKRHVLNPGLTFKGKGLKPSAFQIWAAMVQGESTCTAPPHAMHHRSSRTTRCITFAAPSPTPPPRVAAVRMYRVPRGTSLGLHSLSSSSPKMYGLGSASSRPKYQLPHLSSAPLHCCLAASAHHCVAVLDAFAKQRLETGRSPYRLYRLQGLKPGDIKLWVTTGINLYKPCHCTARVSLRSSTVKPSW